METKKENNQVSTETIDRGLLEQLVLNNDLSGLTSEQRVNFYTGVCKSLGLNPLTQPFGLIVFEKKMMMYARKDGTDQLRKNHRVSITGIETKKEGDLYIVTVRGIDSTGRQDMATGVVPLEAKDKIWNEGKNNGKGGWDYTGKTIPLAGVDLANAIMKAETKAKRRLTLSLVGLGIPDESELETMHDVKVGSFDEPPQSESTIDSETMDQWILALNECKTPDEVDALAAANKHIGEISEIRSLFLKRKTELKSPGNDAKSRAQRSTDFVNEALKVKK